MRTSSPSLPCILRPDTRLAIFGSEMNLVAKRSECRELIVDVEDDIAALAAVTTIGTAKGHELLTMKRDNASTTVAALNVDSGLVL